MNKIKYILQVTPALQVTPVDGIYSLRSDLIFTFASHPLRQIANKLGIGQSL